MIEFLTTAIVFAGSLAICWWCFFGRSAQIEREEQRRRDRDHWSSKE